MSTFQHLSWFHKHSTKRNWLNKPCTYRHWLHYITLQTELVK